MVNSNPKTHREVGFRKKVKFLNKCDLLRGYSNTLLHIFGTLDMINVLLCIAKFSWKYNSSGHIACYCCGLAFKPHWILKCTIGSRIGVGLRLFIFEKKCRPLQSLFQSLRLLIFSLENKVEGRFFFSSQNKKKIQKKSCIIAISMTWV